MSGDKKTRQVPETPDGEEGEQHRKTVSPLSIAQGGAQHKEENYENF